MKKTLAAWIIAAAALMVLIPGLTVRFATTAGMAICFLLFFYVNPVFALAGGVFAGFAPKERWFVPLIAPALYLLGCGLFFTVNEPAFWLYSGIYLLIGIIAMLICAWIRGRQH